MKRKRIFISILAVLLCTFTIAQSIGSKVSFTAVDGKIYTGTITEIQGDKYKVKYDFDAWLTSDQFVVKEQNNTAEPPPKNINPDQQKNVPVKMSIGQIPTKDDIINAMTAHWEKKGTTTQPKVTITINNLTIGSSAKATFAEALDGIPRNALVTAAKMDFTENTFYATETAHTRRIMSLSVYKDKFNEWEAMNVGCIYPQ